jgi:hypothetical protein
MVSQRYELLRVIGKGGMGVVYEAIDHERRQRVALKTLLNFSADALYRFKNEFRTLADVRHRNLVNLHEFVMTDMDHVFFTMELVRGIDFKTYVRSEPPDATIRSSPPPTRPSLHPVGEDVDDPIVLEPMLGPSLRQKSAGCGRRCSGWLRGFKPFTLQTSSIATSSLPTCWSPPKAASFCWISVWQRSSANSPRKSAGPNW